MVEKKNKILNTPTFLKNIIFSGQLKRFLIYLSAFISAVVFLILALLGALGIIYPLKFSLDGSNTIFLFTWYDFVIFALFSSCGVFGIYEFFRIQKIRKIDNRFPDFVRDLAESRRAGMTFTKAIMNSSKGNYGVLTSEIEKIARQISWGSSVETALSAFAKRVNTKLIRRTISLIIEASRGGGNVADVLDAASKDARELKLLDSERRAGMLSYVAVIYVAMFVFLVIVVILSKTLIPNMIGEGASGLQMAASGGSVMSEGEISTLFFWAAIIQSSFMGIVAGVFEEGKIVSGVKHSFFMLIITWAILKFIVTGI